MRIAECALHLDKSLALVLPGPPPQRLAAIRLSARTEDTLTGSLTLVTTVLVLGLVALLHSHAAAALVLAQNIDSAQSKTTGPCLSITVPAGGVATVLSFTVSNAFTTPTAVMANRNRPESNPGEAAAFNIKSAAPTPGQVNQASRAGLV